MKLLILNDFNKEKHLGLVDLDEAFDRVDGQTSLEVLAKDVT